MRSACGLQNNAARSAELRVSLLLLLLRAGGFSQEVRRIMAEVDREGTGTIEFPEFLSISKPPIPSPATSKVATRAHAPAARRNQQGVQSTPGCCLTNALLASA